MSGIQYVAFVVAISAVLLNIFVYSASDLSENEKKVRNGLALAYLLATAYLWFASTVVQP